MDNKVREIPVGGYDNNDLFLGVDGGGTSCRARLADGAGRVLGNGAAGSANTRLGVDAAFSQIIAAARAALNVAGLDEFPIARLHVGAGLAGLTLPGALREFAAHPHPFAELQAESDAYIACLGAHGGAEGGILICGTGAIGCRITGSDHETVGGWGFQVADEGSGARTGHEALRQALLAHENVIPPTRLSRALMAKFGDDPEILVRWAETAKPRDYGSFVPLIVDHAARGDVLANRLLNAAAAAATALLRTMVARGTQRIALLGGFSPILESRLATDVRPYLVAAQGDAQDGALALIRNRGRVS